MSTNCSHQCSSCQSDCADRKQQSLLLPQNGQSRIRKVIAIVSGKGGVGKSMVTSSLSVLMQRKGYQTAILDADITGPSMPRAFGITEKALATQEGILPVETKTGIKMMSVNLLLDHDTDPVVWRGPVIAETVKQFWQDVLWGEVDYMFLDMPPGTGDVPLTVFQSLPIDGIVIVTSPQELVGMIVDKAVKMAKMMQIPILGIVENMSYFSCPDCGGIHHIFGESKVDEIANKHTIPMVCKLPIDSAVALRCDAGKTEDLDGSGLNSMADFLEKL